MTAHGYLKAIRAGWALILAGIVICMAVAYAFVATSKPIYTSSIQMFVSTDTSTTDLTQINQGGSFAVSRVTSYVKIVNSDVVTKRVVSNLGLNVDPASVAKEISASSPLDSVLINVNVADPSPRRAQQIAGQVGEVFPDIIKQLETVRASGTSPVRVSVTRNAELPDAPSSPNKTVDLGLGLVAGLVLGIGAAVARRKFDSRIRGGIQAADVVSLPLVGSLSEAPNLRSRTLFLDKDFRRQADEIRQLRTNLRFLSVDSQLSSFVVTSSVANEGKTMLTANVALTMAQMGKKVVVIDGDLRRPRIADLFSVPGGSGLTNVLVGDLKVTRALQEWRDDLPLYILAAGSPPPNSSDLLGSERLSYLVDSLVDEGFTVIFDSPPVLAVTDATLIARATGGVLMVTNVARTRTAELTAAVHQLRTAKVNILGLVANRDTGRRVEYYAPARQPGANDWEPAPGRRRAAR